MNRRSFFHGLSAVSVTAVFPFLAKANPVPRIEYIKPYDVSQSTLVPGYVRSTGNVDIAEVPGKGPVQAVTMFQGRKLVVRSDIVYVASESGWERVCPENEFGLRHLFTIKKPQLRGYR